MLADMGGPFLVFSLCFVYCVVHNQCIYIYNYIIIYNGHGNADESGQFAAIFVRGWEPH